MSLASNLARCALASTTSCPSCLPSSSLVRAYNFHVYSILSFVPCARLLMLHPLIFRYAPFRKHCFVSRRSCSDSYQQCGSCSAARCQSVHNVHQIALQGNRQQHAVQNRLPRPEDLCWLQELQGLALSSRVGRVLFQNTVAIINLSGFKFRIWYIREGRMKIFLLNQSSS